jgi:hypothetical protein
MLAISLLVNGCRRGVVPADETSKLSEPIQSFEQSLSFSWTGTSQYRRYSKIFAFYSGVSGQTIIETFDDSTTAGKLFVQIRGDKVGIFRYNVTGSPTDTNQLNIRFVPAFNGSSPAARFELTGIATDSLEAEVVITYFGAARDSIVGTIAAVLKATTPIPGAKILLYDGRFKVQRQQ